MNHKKIVDHVHVGFIHIFIPQFLTDGIIDVIIFEIGHLYVSLGMLDTRVWDYCWHIGVGGGLRCLDHDGWLAAIAVGCTKVLIQFINCTGELVRGYRSKIEDLDLWATALDLEVGIGFEIQTLCLGMDLLTYIPLGLGCLSIAFIC